MTVSGANYGETGPTLSPAHPSASIDDHFSVLNGSNFQLRQGCVSTDPADFCGGVAPSLDLSVTIDNVSTSNLTFTFTAFLEATADGFDPGRNVFPKGSAFADAMDPGKFSIDLPNGFTFTSASGVLLTQSTAVPEPSSLPLLGAALAILWIMRRRRNTARGGLTL
jgi:hypothetical protein